MAFVCETLLMALHKKHTPLASAPMGGTAGHSRHRPLDKCRALGCCGAYAVLGNDAAHGPTTSSPVRVHESQEAWSQEAGSKEAGSTEEGASLPS